MGDGGSGAKSDITAHKNKNLCLVGTVPSVLKVNAVEGESVQNGTPTPSAPVDIKSVVVSELKTCGKNLFLSDLLTNLYDGYDDSTRGFGIMCDSAKKPFYKANFKENTAYTISALVRHASYDYATFVAVYTDGSYKSATRGKVGEYTLCTLTTDGNKTLDYIGVCAICPSA